MKLIIFTTCKPFIGDDAWRQEQAIKSWTLLEGIEKKIIILGNDEGTKEICDKYNLIHEPDIRTLQGVPYLYDMFLIANNYANDEDVMLWTNSDMIYFQDMIDNILSFKKYRPNEKNEITTSSLFTKNKLDYGFLIEEYDEASRDQLDIGNFGTSLKWNHDYSKSLSHIVSSYYSKYDLMYIGSNSITDEFNDQLSKDNIIDDFGIAYDLNWEINDKSAIGFGYQFSSSIIR